MSACTESPGLMPSGGSLIWILTLNLIASFWVWPVALTIGLLPTSVTTPWKVWFG